MNLISVMTIEIGIVMAELVRHLSANNPSGEKGNSIDQD